MIVETVVLLACQCLVTSARESHSVIQKSLGTTFSGSTRVRNDIIMYRPSGEEMLDGSNDLHAHENVRCVKSGLQCASDGATLVECSSTLDAVSAWDCQRIFPKHLFLDADVVEILCDPFRGRCASLIQIAEPEYNRPDVEPIANFIVDAAQQRSTKQTKGLPNQNLYSRNEAANYSLHGQFSSNNDTKVNGNTENEAILDNSLADPNKTSIENNKLRTETVNTPSKVDHHITEANDVSHNTLTNSSAMESISAKPVASLPFVKCSNEGLHCADVNTMVDCDSESSEPLFELSCSSMLQSSEMESDSGKCDDATTSCLLNLGGFPLRMRVFQSNEMMEGVCQDGTLTCADNSTLVACSGDISIPSYAINCAGEESNDVFYSYCDSKQKGCVIKRKESSLEPETTSIANGSQSQRDTTTSPTTTNKTPSSIVAIPSMFLIPPLIPLSESIGTTIDAGTNATDDRLCLEAGWKCANSSTLVLCSSQVEPLVQLDCSTTDHPYCDVMNSRCMLDGNIVPQSPCLYPGLQCITDHVLGWCSSSLQVRHVTPCHASCDAHAHNCQEPPTTTTTSPSLIQASETSTTQTSPSSSVVPSTVTPLLQLSSSIIPPVVPLHNAAHVQPLLGPCSKPGMQCVGADMLGLCNEDLTLSYVVPCAKLLPYADTNSVEVFCDREIDACAISQVLDSYSE